MRQPRHLVALAAVLLASACASVPAYNVDIVTDPATPIPDKAIGLTVTLSGAPVDGATVAIEVAGKRQALAPVAEQPGVFSTDAFVLPGVGDHAVRVWVKVDGEEASWDATLTAACPTGGAAGSACCAPDACAGGLTCVYGACQTAPAATEARCHAGVECADGICTEGRCAAATCDDGVKNGKEPAIDCGGGCTTGCPTGTPCTLDTDCDAGLCALGSCPLPAGQLVGDGEKKATLTPILTSDLKGPTDLAFSTLDPNQLWVTDLPTDSFVVVFGAGQEGQSHTIIRDFSQHFMEKMMAISFADEPTFGTCGDSRNDYGGQAKPNNFMGPVQWPSDINDYKGVNSAHSVHWDMLHSSPYCMGLASSGGTGYYAFNGYDSSIDWYDFKEPHCPGCDDHSDGVKRRYKGIQVKRVANLPSNLEYDASTSWLYVADSGNGRVIRVDARNSKPVGPIASFFGDGTLTAYSSPVVQTLKATGLQRPSGLALDRGVLYVGDNATGTITAWKIDATGSGDSFGEPLRTFETGLPQGALVGMTVGPDHKLYVVDRLGKRVLRVDP